MKLPSSPQFKTGLFAAVILLILAYATLKVSQGNFLPGGTYSLYLLVDSATGISKKTPVEVAGISVGTVEKIELTEDNKARVEMRIKKGVVVTRDVQARIKTTGFLGDTYIELYQPTPFGPPLFKGETITSSSNYGDISSLTGQMTDIAADIKAITGTMRSLMSGEDSSFAKSLRNIEKITESLKNVSVQNEDDLSIIIQNLRALSSNLNTLVARNSPNVDATLDNISVITEKIKKGEGTIGRLINDDETVEKLNESIDNLNELLGGASKWQMDLGYHTEYLAETEDFKHYISLAVKPKPDKYFLFEVVKDPAPDSTFKTTETTITSGGASTTVTEEEEVVETDKFRFSVQLAKKYYGLTLRGGLIESSGGVGLDYDYGPVGVKFSAFDFETKRGEKPHLKAMGQVNLTKNFYLLGGLDDFISNQQDPDWFMGAGLTMTEDDMSSIFGLMKIKP